MEYLLIDGTPINQEGEQKCIYTSSLSLDEPYLIAFMLHCCENFINNSTQWKSGKSKKVDELDPLDQAKWLLADCLLQDEFCDVLQIFNLNELDEERTVD